jgi:dCTP deaminase
MIVNGSKLLTASPVEPMMKIKMKKHGVSFGLSEAGYDIRIAQDITLHPFKRFALASTVEHFAMPDNLIGVVHDKSTWIRQGLMVGNSLIEPGWRGFLTLELFYFGFWPLKIPAGAGIAQVIFHQTMEKALYRGKYFQQPDKPVAAIMEYS